MNESLNVLDVGKIMVKANVHEWEKHVVTVSQK